MVQDCRLPPSFMLAKAAGSGSIPGQCNYQPSTIRANWPESVLLSFCNTFFCIHRSYLLLHFPPWNDGSCRPHCQHYIFSPFYNQLEPSLAEKILSLFCSSNQSSKGNQVLTVEHSVPKHLSEVQLTSDALELSPFMPETVEEYQFNDL